VNFPDFYIRWFFDEIENRKLFFQVAFQSRLIEENLNKHAETDFLITLASVFEQGTP
jgi:hypothetical protein